MKYSGDELTRMKNVVAQESNEVRVYSFEDPDTITVTDGDDNIYVGPGEEDGSAEIIAGTESNIISTTSVTDAEGIQTALREIAMQYDGDLIETALSL